MIARRALLALYASAMIGACQSSAAPRPAVLVSGDGEALVRLKKGLAQAIGRARVELGPSDPTRTPELTVLPPPPSAHEDRSLAIPTAFRLEVSGDRCFAVREDTGQRHALRGVACRPL